MSADRSSQVGAGTPRVLFVHAHPDDESITTGGTIAALSGRGVSVRVVTCTLGEEGEILGASLSALAADQADQLGGYRISELTAALRALGVDSTRFLGGAGRWRDSGMAGTASADHPRAFVSSGSAAVDALVAEIDAFAPDVIVTYDPDGGYGHPDHIRVHQITYQALERCNHRPRRLAWTVTALSDAGAVHPDPPAGLRSAEAGELPGHPDLELTHRVLLDPAAFSAKVQALREHATQLTVVPGSGEIEAYFALTNGVLQAIPAAEWYISFERHSSQGDGSGTWTRCPAGDTDLMEGL